jgi:hypothetical protein
VQRKTPPSASCQNVIFTFEYLKRYLVFAKLLRKEEATDTGTDYDDGQVFECRKNLSHFYAAPTTVEKTSMRNLEDAI